jgi:hypothetical protein
VCFPSATLIRPTALLRPQRWRTGFKESEHWYDHLEKHIGWKSLGKVLCGWVTQPGDIEGKPELQQAYALGKSIKQHSIFEENTLPESFCR